jgi:hypothetical protein
VPVDALFLALANLHFIGGHLHARFQAHQVDFVHRGPSRRDANGHASAMACSAASTHLSNGSLPFSS